MDSFSGRGRPEIDRQGSFRLSEQGREKLTNFDGSSGMQIMAALETGGSMDLDELRRTTKLGGAGLERVLVSLMRKGYVQQGYAGGGEY